MKGQKFVKSTAPPRVDKDTLLGRGESLSKGSRVGSSKYTFSFGKLRSSCFRLQDPYPERSSAVQLTLDKREV